MDIRTAEKSAQLKVEPVCFSKILEKDVVKYDRLPGVTISHIRKFKVSSIDFRG